MGVSPLSPLGGEGRSGSYELRLKGWFG